MPIAEPSAPDRLAPSSALNAPDRLTRAHHAAACWLNENADDLLRLLEGDDVVDRPDELAIELRDVLTEWEEASEAAARAQPEPFEVRFDERIHGELLDRMRVYPLLAGQLSQGATVGDLVGASHKTTRMLARLVCGLYFDNPRTGNGVDVVELLSLLNRENKAPLLAWLGGL